MGWAKIMLACGARLLTLLLVFTGLASIAGTAFAEKRVALVIGNSDYVHAPTLRNPANDATAMAARLEKLNFEVVKGINLDQSGMRKAINEFAQDVASANVGLLFYAGHGLQVDGVNYLLPIDAELHNEIDLQFQGVSVNLLLRIMESKKRTSIVLLDACRNNPLAEQLARSIGTGARGSTVSSGLARIDSGVGTYIGFSTSPSHVALDGDGDNSPFTTALLDHISTPGEDIESIMRNVREDVIDMTNGSQVPWGNSSLVGHGFVFNKAPASKKEEKVASLAPPPVAPLSKPATPPSTDQALSATDKQLELAFWNAIKDQNDVRMLLSYLSKYPNGEFAELARLKIDAAITGRSVPLNDRAVTAQPPAPPAVKPSDQAASEKTPRASGAESGGMTAEDVYWQSISNSKDPGFFEAYLQQFPNGTFSSLAKLKIELLKRAAAAQKQAEARKQSEASNNNKPDTQPDQVASLEKRSLDVRPVQPQPEIVREPTREDIRAIQEELNRLGCSVGRADGIWGSKSRSALSDYADNAGVKLASLEPSLSLIEDLKVQKGRICPLVCGRGFVERNGQCERIATTPARQPTASSPPRVVQQVAPAPAPQIRRRIIRQPNLRQSPFQDHGTEDP